VLTQSRIATFNRMHRMDMGSLKFYQACNALLSQKLTIYDTLVAISSSLPQLSIDLCYIVFISPEDPEVGEMRLSFNAGKILSVQESNFPRIPIKSLTDAGASSIFEHIGVMTIAYENSLYGYMVLSIKEEHFEQYSMVQNMISQLIHAAMSNELLSCHIQTLTQKNDILSRLSIIDEFTGLYNRRALHITGKNMYQEANERNETSCVIFLDMDGLKKINDTYGHKDGDLAIQTLGNILKNCFREKDLIVRYGGDEFIVLMVNIHEEMLTRVFNRILGQVAEFNETSDFEWLLSVSWGYVFNRPSDIRKNFESIIEESDAKLYEEKKRKKREKQ